MNLETHANSVERTFPGIAETGSSTDIIALPANRGAEMEWSHGVAWGFSNLVIGWLLVCRIGNFDLRGVQDVAVLGVGGLAMSLYLARRFGRFHGGNTPLDS